MSEDDWRPTVPALCVTCPLCKQPEGRWCLDEDRHEMNGWHRERTDLANNIWPPLPVAPRVDLHEQIAQLRAALKEACDIATSHAARCEHLSDFIGRGALTDDARCNNLMPCSEHGEAPRIAELRRLAEGD